MTRRPSGRGITRLLEGLLRAEHPAQGHPHRAELARGHLRRSGEEGRHEPPRGLGDLPVRDGAHRAHDLPEHRVAGAFDVALFRRVRRRDRLAHPGDRRRRLWRVHRAGADHDDAADAERDERLVRHLFPALRRHDLRDSVGADIVVRDRARLCRRGRHQVDHPRPHHPRHRRPVRAAPDRASGLDAGVPGPDRGDLQPVRLHHRAVGRGLREAADHSAARSSRR